MRNLLLASLLALCAGTALSADGTTDLFIDPATGATIIIGVEMNNISQLSWTSAQGYSLAVTSDPSALFQGATRLPMPGPGAVVAPGFFGLFIGTIQAPGAPGVYAAQVRMIQENVAFFGETATLTLNVLTPPNAASGWEIYE